MKLLLDEGIPWRSAAILREAGHDAKHVIDLDMGGAPDAAILATALADGAVVVTLDSDFHQLLALTGAAQPSVIRIRQEGLSHQTTADWIARVAATVGHELAQGVAVSINTETLRVRKLPLGTGQAEGED